MSGTCGGATAHRGWNGGRGEPRRACGEVAATSRQSEPDARKASGKEKASGDTSSDGSCERVEEPQS